MDELPCEQLKTSIEAMYHHASNRRATYMDETVFGPDQMLTNGPWETSFRRDNLFRSISNEKVLSIEKDGSCLVRSSWSVYFEVIKFELSF